LERNYFFAAGLFCGSSNFTLGAGAVESVLSSAAATGLELGAGCTGEISGADGAIGAAGAGVGGTGIFEGVAAAVGLGRACVGTGAAG